MICRGPFLPTNLFENFCDLPFCRKWTKFDIFFDGPLHVSWLGQEVKNDYEWSI